MGSKKSAHREAIVELGSWILETMVKAPRHVSVFSWTPSEIFKECCVQLLYSNGRKHFNSTTRIFSEEESHFKMIILTFWETSGSTLQDSE